MISEAAHERMRAVVAQYPEARSAMLPLLHIAQAEEGYVTAAGMQAVAETIGCKVDEVESIVSFYAMYTQQPLGKRVIKVCTSIACYLRGCDDLMQRLERDLGVKRGQTSADKRFTLLGVECLASCGTAPALQVNDEFEESVTPERAAELIAAWQQEG